MHIVRSRRAVLGATVTTALLLAGTLPASAHITIPDGGAVLGGGFGTVITLKVPHGCEGAPTDTLELKIPDGVTGVKPMAKAGWTITIQNADAPVPSIAPGASLTDEQLDALEAPVVSSITWSGGSLPDDQYDLFPIQAVFPTEPQTLYFPVVQRCGDVEEAWIQIPAEGQDPEELELPAPSVTVVTAPVPPAPAESTQP